MHLADMKLRQIVIGWQADHNPRAAIVIEKVALKIARANKIRRLLDNGQKPGALFAGALFRYVARDFGETDQYSVVIVQGSY